jgi:hypothetical protein
MKTLKCYYAVNSGGQGYVYQFPPRRDVGRGAWCGQGSAWLASLLCRMESIGFEMPRVTWDDEPVELTLSLTYEE